MTTEVQWSELARDAKAVAEQVDSHGQVRVRRRDGVPLVLSREDRVEQLGVGFQVAARALRNLFVHCGPAAAAASLVDEFPWVEVLPTADQNDFVNDFVRATQAAAELGRWEVLAQVITEWKNTALVHADPDLRHTLSVPADSDHGVVPNPEEA